ncbi:MAG: DUF1846 family protein [Clostridia bacterium]|nr:DUF1846 family protein [Clostridia bacterium]
MFEKPFNNDKYKQLQKDEIYDRISKYDKLYIEVGGKIFDDHHAARVLPGFDPNVKIQIFQELKNDLEIIFCINARDIISKKIRNDNGLLYSDEVIRLIYTMRKLGISVCGVMITLYEDHKLVQNFINKCKNINVQVSRSYFINNYPADVNTIVSQDGFGRNDHIKTNKKIILVSAPGANSGKFDTCLTQIYNDKLNGIISGYAKYETFPVWNLPLEHLVNKAYEMATADVLDVNMLDPFYEKAYGKQATNYNRDVEAFPILSKILNMIYGEEIYKSPTDMGINKVGFAIEDDKAVQKASLKEIEKRYEKVKIDYVNHKLSDESFARSVELLEESKELFNKL